MGSLHLSVPTLWVSAPSKILQYQVMVDEAGVINVHV